MLPLGSVQGMLCAVLAVCTMISTEGRIVLKVVAANVACTQRHTKEIGGMHRGQHDQSMSTGHIRTCQRDGRAYTCNQRRCMEAAGG